MKLKYYLRGLGIGIVVTAIIMTVTLGNKQPMTDEEVIARAKQLGMIENSVLTDIAGTEKETEPKDDVAADIKEEVKPDTETEEDVNKEPEQDNGQDEDKKEPVKSEETEKGELSDKDTVAITVVSGDSSWTVSKRMEEAGLIESAKDFDTHLCRYGYDKKISVGTYQIPVTATYEEMAKIITKTDQ
ncbi:MAG: hypothetical protein IJ274_04445 [Lachnospiraceae bacterium]|nr:hypothetical protein [Lachnospiraceae bacterium]